MKTTGTNGLENERVELWLDLVRRQVGSLDFGLVQIVVHDGRVVQIERTEKIRLETSARSQTEGIHSTGQTSGGRQRNNS